MLERANKVVGSSVATDVAIDTRRIDVEGAADVLFNFVAWIGHEAADYADFTD